MPLYFEMISHKVRWAFHQETMGLSYFWASVGPIIGVYPERPKARKPTSSSHRSGRQRDLLPRCFLFQLLAQGREGFQPAAAEPGTLRLRPPPSRLQPPQWSPPSSRGSPSRLPAPRSSWFETLTPRDTPDYCWNRVFSCFH